jgi:hypothetical protein
MNIYLLECHVWIGIICGLFSWSPTSNLEVIIPCLLSGPPTVREEIPLHPLRYEFFTDVYCCEASLIARNC